MIIALRSLMRDQRGVALPLALIALLILTMLVLTVLNLGAVEPTISRTSPKRALSGRSTASPTRT